MHPLHAALLASIFVLFSLIFVYFSAELAARGRGVAAVFFLFMSLITFIFFALALSLIL